MVLIACELASKWSGAKKKIEVRSKLSVAWGRKEAGELVALLPTASPTCYYPVTRMSITCQYGNYTCQIMMFFYACIDFNNICAQLGIFRGMGNAANQLVTLDSGIIDVRHKNKVYNHPLPPPLSPFLFFPPKPRSACRFSIWPRSTCEPVRSRLLYIMLAFFRAF